MLEGLKALGEHLEEWGRTEGELKAVVGRLGEMEGRAGEQMVVANDPSTQLQPLDSPLDSDLRALRKSLLPLESSHQSSLLSDHLSLKVPLTQTLEVSSKETVLDLIRSSLSSFKSGKEELVAGEKEMRAGYVSSSKEGQTAVNTLRDRFETQKEVLENEVIAGLLQSKGAGKAILEREVMKVVDQEVSALRSHLSFQSNQLDLLLKQELLALRIQLDSVKASAVPISLSEGPGEEQVQTAYSAAEKAVTSLTDLPTTAIADLRELVGLLEAEVREIAAELDGKPENVSEKLEAALFQLEIMQKSVSKLQDRTETEPQRLIQGAQALEAAYGQLGQDSSAANSLQARISSLSLASPVALLQQRLSSLSLSLQEAWTRALKTGQAPPLPETAVWSVETVQS